MWFSILANKQVRFEVGLLEGFHEFCLAAYEGFDGKGVVVGGGGGDENLLESDIIWIDGIKGVEPVITTRLTESQFEQTFHDDG